MAPHHELDPAIQVARQMARRVARMSSRLDQAELESRALVGLVKALRDWTPARGPLAGFCRQAVRWEIATAAKRSGPLGFREQRDYPATLSLDLMELQSPDQTDRQALLGIEGDLVRRAVLALPASQREAVVLRWWCGHDYATIARLQGTPPRTAYTRVKAGEKGIRSALLRDRWFRKDAHDGTDVSTVHRRARRSTGANKGSSDVAAARP